jgi:hypothetical protein
VGGAPRGPNPYETQGEYLGELVGSAAIGVIVWALFTRRWILAGVIGGSYAAFIAIALVVARPWEHGVDREAMVQGCRKSCTPSVERAAAVEGSPFSGASPQAVSQFCACYCGELAQHMPDDVLEGTKGKDAEALKQDHAFIERLKPIAEEARRVCLERFSTTSSNAN